MPRGESGSDETTDEDEGESELERNRRPRDGEWGTEKKGRVSACRERAQDRPCGLIWADLVAEWERAVACLPCPPLGGVLACYEETAKSGSLAVRNGDSLCIDYALSSY